VNWESGVNRLTPSTSQIRSISTPTTINAPTLFDSQKLSHSLNHDNPQNYWLRRRKFTPLSVMSFLVANALFAVAAVEEFRCLYRRSANGREGTPFYLPLFNELFSKSFSKVTQERDALAYSSGHISARSPGSIPVETKY
jgi:hypothetical protein